MRQASLNHWNWIFTPASSGNLINSFGAFTDDGEVWLEGRDEVGNVDKEGTVWIDGKRDGSYEKGANRKHVAIVFFYGFFEIDDESPRHTDAYCISLNLSLQRPLAALAGDLAHQFVVKSRS